MNVNTHDTDYVSSLSNHTAHHVSHRRFEDFGTHIHLRNRRVPIHPSRTPFSKNTEARTQNLAHQTSSPTLPSHRPPFFGKPQAFPHLLSRIYPAPALPSSPVQSFSSPRFIRKIAMLAPPRGCVQHVACGIYVAFPCARRHRIWVCEVRRGWGRLACTLGNSPSGDIECPSFLPIPLKYQTPFPGIQLLSYIPPVPTPVVLLNL